MLVSNGLASHLGSLLEKASADSSNPKEVEEARKHLKRALAAVRPPAPRNDVPEEKDPR